MPPSAARRSHLPTIWARPLAPVFLLIILPAILAQSPRGEMFPAGPEQAEGMATDNAGNLYITRLDATIGTPVSLAFHRQLWIGANMGLWSFDGHSFTAHPQVQGGSVYELVPGPNNLLLINIGDGQYTASASILLARLEAGKIQSITKLAPASRFNRPAFDANGNIYYISNQKVFFLPAQHVAAAFQGANHATPIPTPRFNNRNAALLISDGAGGVWAYGGAVLAHYRDGQPTQPPQTSPFFDPIPGIGPQACLCNGNLWFLSKFNLFTLQRGAIFRWHPEPATRALTIRGLYCDPANELWMGLNAGLRKIPIAAQHSSAPFLRVQTGATPWTIPAGAPTRFPYGNHTVRADLSIPVLLPAGAPNTTQYRFRLLGIEDDWSVTSEPEFAFAAAQPSHYRLEADIQINGQWSPQPAVYEFQIDPRPLSPWLWPLAAAALAATAAAAWLWRRRLRESAWGIPDTTLGQRYRITERIAETNISYVFRARDTKLANRPVVLKVIRRIAVHKEAIATFRREVEALSRLRHRGIVTIQDVGVLNDGRPFLVMELIEGESLRAVLHRGPLPPHRTARVLAQLGQTIAIAHANGIIHRDLKPENLMLEFPG